MAGGATTFSPVHRRKIPEPSVARKPLEAPVQVIINSDHNIALSETSSGDMSAMVEHTLGRFDSDLTRVEVHLSDESAGRSTGDDIRCLIEARPEGLKPETVTDNASSATDALSGALRKMVSVLDTTFGRRDHRKGGTPMGGAETS